jgi:hypothetical protein
MRKETRRRRRSEEKDDDGMVIFSSTVENDTNIFHPKALITNFFSLRVLLPLW